MFVPEHVISVSSECSRVCESVCVCVCVCSKLRRGCILTGLPRTWMLRRNFPRDPEHRRCRRRRCLHYHQGCCFHVHQHQEHRSYLVQIVASCSDRPCQVGSGCLVTSLSPPYSPGDQ